MTGRLGNDFNSWRIDWWRKKEKKKEDNWVDKRQLPRPIKKKKKQRTTKSICEENVQAPDTRRWCHDWFDHHGKAVTASESAENGHNPSWLENVLKRRGIKWTPQEAVDDFQLRLAKSLSALLSFYKPFSSMRHIFCLGDGLGVGIKASTVFLLDPKNCLRNSFYFSHFPLVFPPLLSKSRRVGVVSGVYLNSLSLAPQDLHGKGLKGFRSFRYCKQWQHYPRVQHIPLERSCWEG